MIIHLFIINREICMHKKLKRILSFTIIFLLIIISFGLFAYIVQKSQDQEEYLKNLLIDENNKTLKAFFSPDDNLKQILISLISCEKKSIKTTIYTLTQKDITQALIDAYNRGVSIQCVIDRSYGSDRFSKIPRLANRNIPIWVYQTDEKNGSLMHNKFFIFKNNILGKSIIWTGSYNLTNRASDSNQENIIILDDKQICNRYKKQFKILKTRSLMISGNINKNYKNNYIKNKNIKDNNLSSRVDYFLKWFFKIIKNFRTLIKNII